MSATQHLMKVLNQGISKFASSGLNRKQSITPVCGKTVAADSRKQRQEPGLILLENEVKSYDLTYYFLFKTKDWKKQGRFWRLFPGLCLSRWSIAVRHHDHANPYKGKHLIGGWLTVLEV